MNLRPQDVPPSQIPTNQDAESRTVIANVAIADVSRNTPETRYRGLLLERALPSARLMSRTQELLYGDGPCNASQP
jgi:hypothetical protein